MQLFSHYPAIPPPERFPLTVVPKHTCNYLPDRLAQSRAFYASDLSPDAYHDLMNAGFRRSGRVVYQPICRGCRACVPLRVRVNDFSPSKSQRRSRKRNQDLLISIGEPIADDGAFKLYQRYTREWHGSPDVTNDVEAREDFERFLYDSPVRTIEFRYHNAAGELLAVGLCDVCDRSLSSVYFYFDPRESARSLGTFGALVEIDFARQNQVPYYYLGYRIDRCAAMNYKAAFRPFELLDTDGVWREMR